MLGRAGHRALVVGGCVRNAVMGLPGGDVDIATDARPETVMRLAEAAGFRAVPTGIEHGTVTVVVEGAPYEVTTFRRDVETDGRRAVVAFSDRIEDDARRRDFTMNALYVAADGALVDPLSGVGDARARRVRFIEDPAQRIAEDHLRILRFFRFLAWYGDPAQGPDPEGLAACAEGIEGLDRLSRERVGAELKKLLAAPDPAPAVASLAAIGGLARVLPGADARALAPLVHLERLHGVAPDPLRRLAVLGGESADLRLSKAETRRLKDIRAALAAGEGAAALGYRHGAETAVDALLIGAASLGQPLDPASLDAAREGARQRFPVSAADLPHLAGPELGRKLRELETRWVDSGFTLGRDQLIG
nr:CCA tRNA nucleotidyltransferase [Frigidibacter sp. ROC022]